MLNYFYGQKQAVYPVKNKNLFKNFKQLDFSLDIQYIGTISVCLGKRFLYAGFYGIYMYVRNQQLTYPEKRSTWNVTIFPSKLAGFFRSSVISTHSFCSPSDLRNNTLTRHADRSAISCCLSPKETGSWIVTGFKNSTTSVQKIRRIGPNNISLP